MWNNLSNTLSIGKVLVLNEPVVNEPVVDTPVIDKPVEKITYTVIKGDTLYGISRKFGISVQQLVNWNQLLYGIQIGQTLVVANGDETATTPTEQTEFEKNLIKQNYAWTEVKEGDTWSSIATTYKLSEKLLRSYNPNQTDLKPGIVLKVSRSQWINPVEGTVGEQRPDGKLSISFESNSAPVIAVADGTIRTYGYTRENGLFVSVDYYLNGKFYRIFYCDLDEMSGALSKDGFIKKGQLVGRGQKHVDLELIEVNGKNLSWQEPQKLLEKLNY
jgi:LysM repeat protein